LEFTYIKDFLYSRFWWAQNESPPVIICPYVHAWEAPDIKHRFGLDEPHGKKLDFFLWQDLKGIGPERAFEYCWNQFPDKDIIIMHSDMAPMPDDKANAWYDALLRFRKNLPRAGMIACNLFYPRQVGSEAPRVQCAGGTFAGGQIGYIHGLVSDSGDSQGMVSKSTLERVRPVDWVTFGGVLIRRRVINECGPIDRRYEWAYVMDVDYCFEARSRGYQLFQVPVYLQHEGSRTTQTVSNDKPELLASHRRNFELFYDKWGSSPIIKRGRPLSLL